MKQILALLLLVVVGLAACSAPSEDAPRAQAADNADDNVLRSTIPGDSPLSAPTGRAVGDAQAAVESNAADNEDLVTKQLSSQSTFEFEGFGVGKSHEGVFDEFSGHVDFDGDAIVGGELVIQAASLNTGIGGLDSHLKNEDFFEVDTFPEITATLLSVNEAAGQITGEITIKGTTQELTFPAEISSERVSADFIIDLAQFGVSKTGVDDEARVAFDLRVE